MVKIFLDPGHGGSDPGAIGNGLYEKNLTLSIALKTRDILNNEFVGHTLMLSRTGDQTVSLQQRTNMANSWGADYLLSIHINAGGGTGFESYIYNGSYPGKNNTNNLRGIIHNEVIAETGYRDRGKKEANFHILRESNMDAALTENGFIDNADDAAKLKSSSFIEKLARGHAEGLAKAFNLSRKADPAPAPDGDVLYRVVAGSFTQRENADSRKSELAAKGYDSFILTENIYGTIHYRVIAGTFEVKENAKKRVQELEADGFASFIAEYDK